MHPSLKVTTPGVAHIGVAVADTDEALRFYRNILGAAAEPAEHMDGANIVAVRLGDVRVELMTPTDPAGPVGKFLARRGPGIHHLCFRVPDLDAALERCRAEGYRLVDEHPRVGHGGRRIAFVHPKTTSGILIELTE